MTQKKSFSKTMPKGEARPLGTPRPKIVKTTRSRPGAAEPEAAAAADAAQKTIDATDPVAVESPQPTILSATDQPTDSSATDKETTVTLTLKGLGKNKKFAIYSGTRAAIYFPLSCFADGTAPQTVDINAPLLPPAEKAAPAAALTPEEKAAREAARKAERANRPKLTLAEQAERAQKRAEALAAKAAAAALAAQAGQGSGQSANA